jgi:hypothetical protein
VLILLPPSEGKAAAAGGAPVQLADLWLPALAPARRRVVSRLAAMCRRGSARGVAASLATLGLTAGQRDDLARNAALAEAPAAEARTVPASADELVAALRDLTFTVAERPVAAGRPRQLDVVVAAL